MAKTTQVLQGPHKEIYGRIRAYSRNDVIKYASAMKAAGGAGLFPNIRASKDGWIYDGASIFEAAKSAGFTPGVVFDSKRWGQRPLEDWITRHVECNSTHGRALTQYEQEKAIAVLHTRGMALADMARHFNLDMDQIRFLSKNVVCVIPANVPFKPSPLQKSIGDTGNLPRKGGVPDGAIVTSAEYAAMDRKDRGCGFVPMMDQCSRWILNPTLVPWTPENLKSLDKFLGALKARRKADKAPAAPAQPGAPVKTRKAAKPVTKNGPVARRRARRKPIKGVTP